jgi:lipid II:glycine glycyltransferase (peptidoglycan interpeptide bridge formation enzyme)
MDEELKQYLDALKRELHDTKRELLEVIQTTKREVLDHTEAVETRLLAEFWKWARTADARYR